MKIPKRSDMTAAAIAGKTAKKAGHEFEHRLAGLFDKLFGGEHIVDGRPSTHTDYGKVMKMVDPHERENDLSDGIVVGASVAVTKRHLIQFMEKYDPTNQNLIILKEEK